MELDYKLIGQRLASCRKSRGLKQREVCEMADINDKYLSNIEHARSIPSLEVLMRLCTALDITPDAILIGTEKYSDTQKAHHLCNRICTLSPEQMALIDDLIDCIILRNAASQ